MPPTAAMSGAVFKMILSLLPILKYDLTTFRFLTPINPHSTASSSTSTASTSTSTASTSTSTASISAYSTAYCFSNANFTSITWMTELRFVVVVLPLPSGALDTSVKSISTFAGNVSSCGPQGMQICAQGHLCPALSIIIIHC